MKNKYQIKFLTLLIIAICVMGKTYGDTEVEQIVDMSVQPTVAITKAAESIESGTVNAQTGVINGTGLKSVFTLQTNGTDEDYDFIITSTIQSTIGNVSAYTQNGDLLFGNTTNLPMSAEINNAKSGGNNNPNVIVYPVTLTTEGSMTGEFQLGNATYGDCYKILVNGDEEERKVKHSLGTTPVAGSYNVSQDVAGSYQAIVTFTSIAK